MSKPTALEKAVLQLVVEQLHSPHKESMAQQATSASVLSRENSGASFYTYFDFGIGPYSPLPSLAHITVEARVNGLSHGVGFIAWTKDGRLDYLEGYSYEESTVPLDWKTVTFELVDLRKKNLS
jgi:hypothetical protein